MFKYVVYQQNGRGRWHLMRATTEPEKPYYFETVLSLSHDPDTISGGSKKADTYIQYNGPCYFDLDGEDQGAELEAVIQAAKRLVQDLMLQYTMHHNDIQIFLTGGRGLHVLIDQRYFGLSKAQVRLPKIWGAFVNKFKSDYIDRSIYSMGRGRMWRVPGLERANGKYKVQISYEELMTLETEEQYDLLCSVPRPALAANEPKVNKYLKEEFDRLRSAVMTEEDNTHEMRDQTQAVMTRIEGTPGCIEKLITEGDCESSNWNQASIQLAAYIAARYQMEEADDYMETLVEPFLNNVESSMRPTYSERKSSMDYQLNRAFAGSLPFYVGALIKAIGKPCGACALCRPQEMDEELREETVTLYSDVHNILGDSEGVYKLLPEGKQQALVARPIEVTQMIKDFATDHATGYEVMVGGRQAHVTNQMLNNPRELALFLMNYNCTFLGTERDLRSLAQVIMDKERDDTVDMVYTSRVAGIQLKEMDEVFYDDSGTPSKRKKLVPFLVARDGVFTSQGDLPPIVSSFHGKAGWTPRYLTAEMLKPGDVGPLDETLSNLFKINEFFNVATIVGFMCVSHLKEHIRVWKKEFPLLNLNGTSETGKSSTLFLMHTLNGFEYGTTAVWNAEVDTPYPLEDQVSTSSTFVRVIEEVNEATAKKNWSKVTGILKAAWDSAGIDKGRVRGGELVTDTLANRAPIVFLSEQPHPVDSVRSRSLVCKFKSSIVRDPAYADPFRAATRNAKYLEMLGRCMLTRAVSYTVDDVKELESQVTGKLRGNFQARGLVMYEYVLLGLRFLQVTLESIGSTMADEVGQMFDQYVEYLNSHAEEFSDSKKASVLDEIMSAFDTMAAEYDNPQHGLEPGIHYWKKGSVLYLDPRIVFPRFRRYIRGVGLDQSMSINTAAQFIDMLEREDYFKGMINHPLRARARVIMLDLDKLADREVSVSSYEDSEPL